MKFMTITDVEQRVMKNIAHNNGVTDPAQIKTWRAMYTSTVKEAYNKRRSDCATKLKNTVKSKHEGASVGCFIPSQELTH